MCDLNIAQDEPRKPVHLNIIDIKSLEKSIQDYMSKISEVDIKQLMYTSSPEDFVDAFRKGFDFAEHNFLENGNGILCYDLMICQNPLDEQKKQLFYTFFSQDSVYEKKLRLAKIYQYYLDFYPEYHIDTMLQICYTENCDDIKEGFYLKFEDAGCKMFSLGNSEENDKELKSFDLNGNRLSDCEPYIPDMSNIDEDGIIEKVIGKFEKYIDDNTKRTVDEKSEYVDYVSAFLDKKTPIGKDRDRNVSLKQIQNNAYRISLINELAVPGIKCLYFIPISFPNHKQIGHFVLSTDGTDLKRDKEYIKKFKVLSFVLMFPLSQVNVSSIFMKKAYDESVKSAKAAIMSRNMSHNIGSHVMSYLKQHLCSVTNILQDNVLSDFISSSSFSELLDKIEQARSNNDSFVKYTKELSTEEGSLALPFLVGLGNFISYLQERQDFIATIATDYIPYYSTVNFKDFIYDALNPDKRYLRHKDRKNLQPDNILLGNIARSEGLGRTISPTKNENGKLSDIIIKFRGFDGNPVVNESNIIITGREEAFKDLEFMRGIDVSLPGGMVGRQAIFSIVENIIRNAAKHGNWRNQGKLELTFDFFTKDSIKEEFVRLKQREYPILKKRINGIDLDETEQAEYDRIRKELEPWTKDASSIEGIHPWGEITMNKHLSLIEVLYLFYSQSIDAEDLYFVTITDNIKISETAVNQLRSALTEDYIGSDAKMKEGNKGLKEIRISAAWLRGAKNEDEYYNSDARILEPQTGHKAPLVYARQHNECLQYIICLLIPKRVAIVSDSFGKEIILNKDANKKLSDSYWNIFTPSEYIKEKNKSYIFVVCDGKDCYNMIRPYSSSRIAEISSVENVERNNLFESIQNGISQVECHRIELSLYKYFANYKEGKDIICVDDKKAYARFVNQPTTIAYQWHASSKDEKTGHFLRCQGDSQEVIGVDKEDLYDGMGLIPEHNYCKLGNVIVTDGGGFGQYVYRTHHDMNEEFARFMGELRNNYKGCQFVESVTGNSSTDRLVRNDSLDDKWFYSHLRAMKQQIAIFDERLFAKFYGLEEVDFTRANAASGTLDERKKEYIRQFPPNFASNINKCKSVDELNMYISSNNALMKKLYKSEAGAKSRSVSVNYQKGIFVFTFVRDSQKNNKYGMYGLCLKPDKTDVLDAIGNVFHATTMKLVDLSWENDSLKITPEPDTEYPAKCFDYISIHQGLLDKLYDAFDIKNNENAKVELTKRLYLFLKRGDQEIMNVPIKDDNSIQKEEHLFMPGIIVHSGRSKPNKNDMPQLLPFIQYAAIEHAALDCKYSLVELLDNARIEL